MLFVFGTVLKRIRLDVSQGALAAPVIFTEYYESEIGGRGALSAVAAARLCIKVALVARTGDGYEAAYILPHLRQEGVITSAVARSDTEKTGCVVDVYEGGVLRHSMFSLGAGADTSHAQIPEELLNDKAVVLLQNELREEENRMLLAKAKRQEAKTVFHLAPRFTLPPEDLKNVDYLVVSEKQAGPFQDHAGLIIFHPAGEASVKLPDGMLWRSRIPVRVIQDSAGMEEAFCGIFAAFLHEGAKVRDAVQMASIAAVLTGEKEGAYTAPHMQDIQDAVKALAAG